MLSQPQGTWGVQSHFTRLHHPSPDKGQQEPGLSLAAPGSFMGLKQPHFRAPQAQTLDCTRKETTKKGEDAVKSLFEGVGSVFIFLTAVLATPTHCPHLITDFSRLFGAPGS